MSKIAILTQSCKYFAVPFLAKAIGADLYVIDHSQDGFFGEITDAKKYVRGHAIDCEHLIIIGARALHRYAARIAAKTHKTVAVIFSDTNCCILSGWWNRFVEDNNVFVYIMPDLVQYCRGHHVPAFQTMTMPQLDAPARAEGQIAICHSPGAKGAYKGSKQIAAAITQLSKSYPIKYTACKDLSWHDCLKAKAAADIFIDQLVLGNPKIPQDRFGGKIAYNGALGKSGLEAMLLGCCVVSGCQELKTEPYFPNPPIVYTTGPNIVSDLEWLITEKQIRRELSLKQREWARSYLSPEFVGQHLTRHINEAV